MKKLISVILSAMMLTSILSACGGTSQNSGTSSAGGDAYRITIVQPMSHTSLDQIRDTIVAELNASGKNIVIGTKNANGDTTALGTILENCKAEGVDLVIPIATSTAQSAKAVFDGTGIPIVFAAVSDPAAAGLTVSDCQNITGVSNNIPADEIVKLIFNFQPDCGKIGFLYTSSEANSVSTIATAKEYCDIAYGAGIPIYCGADSMVADGGFATIGVNYVQLGQQAADLALKIAEGAAPADLPYETLSDYAKFVNLQAASRFGASFPESAYAGYEVLVEADGTSHFGQ